jgi:hypothetical protein
MTRHRAGESADSTIPGGRVGEVRELGWAATFLCSPFASYISGHTLVVDGANWLRRSLVMPEFTPIREQFGKGGSADAIVKTRSGK